MTFVTVMQDSDGQLVFPFDTETLAQMGWATGDTLNWTLEENGTVVLTKSNDQD